MEEIICKKCGVHAAVDETFCGGCGAFLEWEGERVVIDDGPPIAAAVPAAPERPTQEKPVQEKPAQERPAQERPTAVPPPPAGPVAVQPAPPITAPAPAPACPGAPGRAGRHILRPVRPAQQSGASLLPAMRYGPIRTVVAVRLPWWKRIFRRQDTTQNAAVPAADGTVRAQPSEAPRRRDQWPPSQRVGARPSAPSAPRPPAPAASPRPPAAPYAPPLRPVPSVRMPAGPSARPHRLRGKVAGLVVLVIVVFAVVPSLRHTVSNWYTSAYHQLVPSYSKVPVERVEASGSGDCWPLSCRTMTLSIGTRGRPVTAPSC